ncbi:hypothetical protein [Fodinicola acaciae]|uniref:hypothetical protein n=1 Tax=Fodinicola acaciae TaxID=2681555 RepID=UPI0013D51112|nr:hypothetical protein [Fodinicola acaciae]
MEKTALAQLLVRRCGAVCYALWGVLHVYVGITLLTALLRHGTDQGRQVAWGQMYYSFVVVFGVLVAAVALRLNWRGDLAGYWINLAIVVSTDSVFAVIMMAPGYITFSQGISGPILAAPAVVLTTIALIWSRRRALPSR